jgi:hypothetical protein
LLLLISFCLWFFVAVVVVVVVVVTTDRFFSRYIYWLDDHSRVVLPEIPHIEGSDYVNASTIGDETGDVALIASQV